MSNLLSNVMGHAAQNAGAPKSVRGHKESERTDSLRRSADPEEATQKRVKNHGAKTGGQAAVTGQKKKKLVRRRVRRSSVKSAGYKSSTPKAQPKTAQTGTQGQSAQTAQHQGSGKANLWRSMAGRGSLTQASLQFEQSQPQDTTQRNVRQTRQGQQRYMLNRMVRMVEVSLAQHTGGSAGEAYPRRETRQIYSALLGLKNSSPNKRDERRTVRHTEAELAFTEGKAKGLMAIFEPESVPADYTPLEMVA